MNKLFAILLLLLSVSGFGQSAEADMLYRQGNKLLLAEKFEEAIPYYQKCDSLDKATLTPASKNYYRAESSIAYCLLFITLDKYRHCNFQDAVKLGTQAMEIIKKIKGEEDPDYVTSLTIVASANDAIGNYTEAIRLGTQAMEINKTTLGEKHPDYAFSLNNLACYNSKLGNYAEAFRLGTQAMEIYKKVLGENHPEYTTSLNNLAGYNANLGNYAEAIRLCTQATEINKANLGDKHPDYALSLNNLATYYAYLGNYAEAVRLCTQAMEIRGEVLGKQHPDYASSLNNLAGYNAKQGNYTEAIRLCTEAMEIRKKVLGEEHPDYARTLSSLTGYYYSLGNYEEAFSFGTQALDIMKKVLGEEHPDYAALVNSIAGYCYDAGIYAEAIQIGTMAMKIREKVLGKQHPDYISSLSNLALYYFKDGNYDEATMLFEQSYKLSETLILKTFAYLTNKERSDFWNKYSDFFHKNMPALANEQPNSTLKSLAFNSQLLSKGLLLNAELEIQNLIEKRGNGQLKDMYNQLRQDRKKLDELYLLAPAERTMNTDSLLKVIDNEERLLVESCKELGDYTKNLSIKWEDIQKKLKTNDVAIEFANFKGTDKEDRYIALIVKKGMTVPELVKLDFNDTVTVDYSSPKLYNKIWKPLQPYLSNVNNVYFSPSGKFHTIGIEYLLDNDGKVFSDKYNVFRLSSTRELALPKTSNPNKKAATFGGIKYDTDKANNGNGVMYLVGTKKESEAVASLLKSAKYKVFVQSDTAATEESFKNLSGLGIKILHISTHGFYQAEEDMSSIGLEYLASGAQNKEDRSLDCSGLLFAGANAAFDPVARKAIPDNVDDGILTAKEISRMDFKGLDLVVLSACQTGLGEVTGEGVFGLQRGFKKAGAQTIIMSLWDVDDYATRLLMVQFFKSLTEGLSKRKAFQTAIHYVKSKNNDPKYWAAFVMVDGEE